MELCPLSGTPLEDIEPFMRELTGIVVDMQEKLVSETVILEGTMETPDYGNVREALENELSIPKLTEEQWRTSLLNGSSTTDPTLTSLFGSSSSSDSVRLSNLDLDIPQHVVECSTSPIVFCEGKSDDCGCETGALSGCCDCMVQTINVPMAGTLSEEK